MKIEEVRTALYRVPLKASWGDQTHSVTHIEILIADMRTDTGITGVGFSYTVGVGGKAAQALIDWYLIPMMSGMEVRPWRTWQSLWGEMHDAGGGGVSTIGLAALDIAAWDALAKAANTRLADYIGMIRPNIPAYGSGINLHYGTADLRKQIQDWVNQGYRGVKIKVGKRDMAEDVERVRLARETAGTLPLMVDANQGWDVTTAIERINAFQPFGLHWVEEPLISDDLIGHAELRRKVNTPIAVGENLYTRYQFRDYLTSHACDFVQADVVRVGGITPFLRIAEMADTWGIPTVPHFMMELTGQLLCCIPNATLLEDVYGGSLSELGILQEDIRVRNGLFEPPSGAGHGIVFDRDMLKQYLVDVPPQKREGLWNASAAES
jgi:L-alanine-DL-glutamate epimerase-like enolase superfamily enzyme